MQFLNEDSIDAGGPYRETLVAFCEEMEAGHVPLWKKTTNALKNHGINRDCFVINNEMITPTQQQMFKFMGALIGYAFRSKSCMPFKLVPSFWKQLCDAPVEEEDLHSIDAYTWQTFKELRKNAKKYKTDEEFEMILDQKFVYTNHGVEIPLCPGGEEKLVNPSNLEEFIKLTYEHIFAESNQQMKWIKEGVHLIIPANILNLV